MSKGIARLNALENDNFQEALNKYPAFLKLPDDIIYSLSREFVDTVKNENIIFLSFHGQVCVDLQSAALSTLRQHDAQACLMLRHALEATALAAYATIFKPGADEAGIMAEFGHTGKAYKWIEAEFPESSKNINPTSAVKNKKLLFFKHFVLKKVKSRHYILLSGPEFSYVWASLSPCVAG